MTISKLLLFTTVGILVGFLAVKQIRLSPEVRRTTQTEDAQVLAVETGELYRTNKKLLQDIQALDDQKIKLSAPSVGASEEALQEAISQLEIITGKKRVIGAGVTIHFAQPLQVSDIIDLINALRNIGAEALTINNRRIVSTTGFTEAQEVTMAVIGNPTVLHDALTRKGGIFEQINIQYTIEKKDNLELPAVGG